MTPRRRAWLALVAACGALLGTSAPTPVFVTTPTTTVTVPAHASGRLRVVLAPGDERESAPARYLLAVALGDPRPGEGGAEFPPNATMFVRSEGIDAPPVAIPVRPPGIADPRATSSPQPGAPPSEDGTTRLRLPPCAAPEPCVVHLTAWTEPPLGASLIVRRPPRGARRTGIFPFDGPDVEGTREEMLQELQLYPLDPGPAPAPAVMAAPP